MKLLKHAHHGILSIFLLFLAYTHPLAFSQLVDNYRYQNGLLPLKHIIPDSPPIPRLKGYGANGKTAVE